MHCRLRRNFGNKMAAIVLHPQCRLSSISRSLGLELMGSEGRVLIGAALQYWKRREIVTLCDLWAVSFVPAAGETRRRQDSRSDLRRAVLRSFGRTAGRALQIWNGRRAHARHTSRWAARPAGTKRDTISPALKKTRQNQSSSQFQTNLSRLC